MRAREEGREALLSRNYGQAVRLLEIASRMERRYRGEQSAITQELLNSARAALARQNAHIHQARQREAEERHPVPEPGIASMLRSEILATPVVLSRWLDTALTFLGNLIPIVIYERIVCRYIHTSYRKTLGFIFCLIVFLGTMKYFVPSSQPYSSSSYSNSPLQYQHHSNLNSMDYPRVRYRHDVLSSQDIHDSDRTVYSSYPYDHGDDPRHAGENREEVQELNERNYKRNQKRRRNGNPNSIPFTYPGDIYYHNPDSGFTFYSPIVSMLLFSLLFRILPMIFNIGNRRMNGNGTNPNQHHPNGHNNHNNINNQGQGNFQVHIGGFPFFPFMNFRF